MEQTVKITLETVVYSVFSFPLNAITGMIASTHLLRVRLATSWRLTWKWTWMKTKLRREVQQQLQENPSVSSNVAGREIPDMQVLMGKLSMNGDFRLRFPEGMCPTCLYNRNINEQQIWMQLVFHVLFHEGVYEDFTCKTLWVRNDQTVCWRLRFSIPIPIPGGSLKLSEPTCLIQRLRRQKDGGRSNSGLCEELAHGLLGYLPAQVESRSGMFLSLENSTLW